MDLIWAVFGHVIRSVAPGAEAAVADAYRAAGLPVGALGSVGASGDVSISVGGQQQITGGRLGFRV